MSAMEGGISADVGRLSLPAVVVHGGAGNFDLVTSDAAAVGIHRGLEAAMAAAWEVLSTGGSALQAAVEAVANLEDSARFNAGRGGVATAEGTFELDAGVMDGTTGRVGAICAATFPANPVRVASKVAEIGGPPDGPVLLAGDGADRFAEAWGFDAMTPAMRAGSTGETEDAGAGPTSESGTVGAVAVDGDGRVAAATSTGGRRGQLPGRVGDSPIPGAGVWADADTSAVSATGAGEAFVVVGFGHRIDWEMRAGRDVAAAMEVALHAVARLGGDGGGIAVTADGSFSAGFNSRAMARGWRDAQGWVTRVLPTAAG
ncbi:MAG: isoaspartyl peptidase/L-asparaginase family protein [Acidimicrobiales bacterium]|jgi:isoaspartyl peptidase/L-asparaginase-like protein (Ntn-hydrolase superfamily)